MLLLFFFKCQALQSVQPVEEGRRAVMLRHRGQSGVRRASSDSGRQRERASGDSAWLAQDTGTKCYTSLLIQSFQLTC